jgi:hypothetical protein
MNECRSLSRPNMRDGTGHHLVTGKEVAAVHLFDEKIRE